MTATSDLFHRLRHLQGACGPNKHDQATILIHALLDEGIDTRPRIIGVLKRLELDAGHIARMLDEGLRAHRWSLGHDGHYAAI